MKTLVIAHRGSSGAYPENTLSAFRAAAKAQADGIELDVHLSRDNHLIVMHDEKVDRTTNGTGLIRELTLDELKRLNAAKHHEDLGIFAAVPTLPEVLKMLVKTGYQGLLNIEIKTDVMEYAGIEEILAKKIRGMQVPFPIVFSSFNFETLDRLHPLLPDGQFAAIFREEGRLAKKAEEMGYLEAMHPKITWLYKNTAKLSSYRKKIRIWTVNEEKDMRFCFDQQIDSFFTNYPELALKIRQEEYDG